MATLTNTQISVTYVGLLKTSGNTILDSTPQQITDGSGNNSQLFLSTTKVGVGATPSGSDTLQITGTSSFSSHVTLADNAELRIGTSTDLQASHDGTDSFIINNTGDFYIRNTADNKDIIFQNDDGSGSTTPYMTIDGGATKVTLQKDLRADDNIKIQVGSSGDLFMVHESNTGKITNGTGDLIIINNTDDGDIIFKSDDGSSSVTEYFRLDGGTTSTRFEKKLRAQDNIQIQAGSAGDVEIVHNGTDSKINNYTGDLIFTQNTDDGDIIFQSDDGSSGTTEYFRVDGGSENVLFSKIVKLGDNVELRIGDGNDLKLFSDGSNGYVSGEQGDLYIRNRANDKDIFIQCDDGSDGVATYLTIDGSVVRTLVSKNFDLLDNVKLRIGTGDAEGAQDLQLYHNGSSSYIEQVGTGDLVIQQSVDNKDIVFNCDDGSGSVTEYFRVDGGAVKNIASKELQFFDNVKAEFGDSSDLQIYHDGTNSRIYNDTGDLYIRNQADGKDIYFQSDNGSGGVATYFQLDGGNAKTSFSRNYQALDNVKAQFGDSNDLEIYHNGTNSEIQNQTGNLNIKATSTDGDIKFFLDDGAGSTTQYVRMDGGAERVLFFNDTEHQDNVKATFGNAGDLEIYHDSSNSYIDDSGTGTLRIRSNFLTIEKYNNGEIMASFDDDNAVSLYHNNSKKFETTSSGVAVTGGMTLSGNVEGRKIPFVFRSSFDDSAGSTSIFVIPFDANVETTVSGADEEHIIIAPYAGELTKVQWKHVKGTLDTGFTTELFLYVNGSQQTSSGELTASSDAITWSPTSSNTFSAGDELMIAYQKSATSKDWEHVSVSVVFSFTSYNI